MEHSIQPSALFALRFVRDARVAPDGCRIAYAVSRVVEGEKTERCDLWVAKLDASTPTLVAGDERYVTAPRWSADGNRLAFIATGPSGNRIRVASIKSGQLVDVSGFQRIESAPTWSPDGKFLAACVSVDAQPSDLAGISGRVFRKEGFGVIDSRKSVVRIFSLSSGEVRDFGRDGDWYSSPKWSPSGDEILVLVSERRTLGFGHFPRLCVLDIRSGSIRDVLNAPWAIEMAEWVPSGDHIVIAGSCGSREGVPAAALWRLRPDGSNMTQRSDSRVPHVGFRYHHDMPVWDAHTAFAVPNNEFAFVTVQAGASANVYRVALTGEIDIRKVVSNERSSVVLDACERTKAVVYWTTAIDSPSELNMAYWDEDGSERQITNLNDHVLAGWPQMQVEHLQFKASDELDLEGWFMARSDAHGAQPTVMFIHGGPYTAIGNVFRFDSWLLAANGFAVLFANFRGSLGYGQEFSLAIDPDWGNQGFPDHMAAIDAVVAKGLADPSRLGVWGASHGGFATAWAIGHTRRFKAAVVEAALTDFSLAYYLSDLPDFFAQLLGGVPHQIPDTYRARSPVSYAHECTTPTLLLHGDSDIRCPIAGAEAFYRALLDAKCTSELVVLKDCDHMGDSAGPLAARLGQNQALLDWFRRHL